MREWSCFSVERTVVATLVAACLLASTIQAAVDSVQQERCVTSSNKAGYCMTKAQCHDQELVDLRTESCSDGTLYCCPIRTENVPSWNRKKQYTQCDSNRGYCVKSDMCSVRTFRLRSNRCPAYEEVCCPKKAFPEEFAATRPSVAKHAIPIINTTSAPSSTTTTTTTNATTTTTTATLSSISNVSDSTMTREVTSPASTTASTPISTVSGSTVTPTLATFPSSTTPSTPDQKIVESSNSIETNDSTQKTATTHNSLGVELIATTVSNDSDPPIIDPSFLDADYFLETVTPSKSNPTTPLNNDASDSNISALMPQFSPQNFSNKECGQLNLNGVVERTINQAFRAEYGEFPWMVALFQLPERRYCCNGALIDAKAILTTAHCVTRCGRQAAEIVARFGDWNMSSTVEMPIPWEEVGVRSVHQHPSFFPSSLINNIAVLELNHAVQYSATVQPVCLPTSEPSLRSRENMIATGWGALLEQNVPPTQILKRLDLQHVELGICRDELKRVQQPYGFTLHSSFVCATTNHADQERPCDGDAGGPVVVELPNTDNRYYLHGLVSWGYGCNQKRIPYTVLTKVVHFREWIDEIVQSIRKVKKSKKGQSKERN
uniref:Peptidase S1 domain-containing protein n=1 Tax=Anopheles christyi TaxID=43041 RepID=A0A182K7B6_9DIPT